MDYITVYLEIEVLVLVYTIVLLANVRSEMGNDREVNIFRSFILALILAVPADAVTQAQYRGFLHMHPTPIAFLYGFYMFMFSGVLPFLWFLFVETRLDTGLLKKRWAVAISIIPLAIMSFMSFASMKTGWFYSIDRYGRYTRGDCWSLQIVVTYCYFLFTTAHAMLTARRETSSVKRKQDHILATFIIAPFIGGLLQLYIGNHPFVAPSISVAMLFIFLNIQGNLIHNDSLTGLFNRKSAEEHIEELKANASTKNPFYIYKMRIDGLRLINYMHGFDEGDKVIKTVANVLQGVANKSGALVASLGGVDFLAVIEGKNLKKTGDFAATIREALEKEAKKQKLPYELKLVIGETRCDSPEAKITTLMHDADREMHLDEDIE